VITDRGAETGAMHACGHDLHLAAMLGTVRILAARKDRWRGTVVFIAQPAEETLDGVKAMLADGLFDKVPRPHYCLAHHCIGDLAAGEVGIIPGPALASVQVLEVIVRGKGGHGSRPHEAKDPIVLAAQIILALQTIVSRETSAVEPVGVTVGAIQGGTRASIIPEEVRLLVSVRALDDKNRDRAVQAVERIARGTALAAGVPQELAPIVRRSEEENRSMALTTTRRSASGCRRRSPASSGRTTFSVSSHEWPGMISPISETLKATPFRASFTCLAPRT
jgi:amidohydrolase